MAITDSQKTIVMGVACDSDEEQDMVYWLQDAIELGLLYNVRHKPYTVVVNEPLSQPTTYLKLNKQRKVHRLLLDEGSVSVIAGHRYTPDVSVNLTDLGMMLLSHAVALNAGREWVFDVKGTYSGGKNNTSGVTFPLKQAMVYDLYGVMVQKVVPVKFFHKTWLPQWCKYTKVKKDIRAAFTKRKKPYPELDDIHKRIKLLQDVGYLDRSTNKATPELVRIWPGVKGVEYDAENRPEDDEDTSQGSFF